MASGPFAVKVSKALRTACAEGSERLLFLALRVDLAGNLSTLEAALICLEQGHDEMVSKLPGRIGPLDFNKFPGTFERFLCLISDDNVDAIKVLFRLGVTLAALSRAAQDCCIRHARSAIMLRVLVMSGGVELKGMNLSCLLYFAENCLVDILKFLKSQGVEVNEKFLISQSRRAVIFFLEDDNNNEVFPDLC